MQPLQSDSLAFDVVIHLLSLVFPPLALCTDLSAVKCSPLAMLLVMDMYQVHMPTNWLIHVSYTLMSRANESCPDVTVLTKSSQVSAQVGLLMPAGASQLHEIAVDLISTMVGTVNVTLVVSEENARFELQILDTGTPRVSTVSANLWRNSGHTDGRQLVYNSIQDSRNSDHSGRECDANFTRVLKYNASSIFCKAHGAERCVSSCDFLSVDDSTSWSFSISESIHVCCSANAENACDSCSSTNRRRTTVTIWLCSLFRRRAMCLRHKFVPISLWMSR